MKIACIALLAVGAFAVQDTTPPVISLNLMGAEQHLADEQHNSDDHGFKISNTHSAGTECIRTSRNSTCPDPTCEAHDHHDVTVKCEDPKVTHVRGQPETVLQNIVNSSRVVERNHLGQYLLTYTAQDKSKNWADPVTFSFLFIDPFQPHFSRFEQDEANLGYYRFKLPGFPINYFEGNVNKKTDLYAPYQDLKNYGRVCNVDTTAKNHVDIAAACRSKTKECEQTGQFHTDFDLKENMDWNCEPEGVVNTYGENKIPATSFELTSGEHSFWRYGSSDEGKDDYSATQRFDTTKWSYNFGATISDANHDADPETPYYDTTQVLKTLISVDKSDWKPADYWTAKGLDTSGSDYKTIDYYTEDGAGVYGYKNVNNPQFHRIELEFYDHIRPKIYLKCYKSPESLTFEAHKSNQHRPGQDTSDPEPYSATGDACVHKVGDKELCGNGNDRCLFSPSAETDVTLECHARGDQNEDKYKEPGMFMLDNVDSWENDKLSPVHCNSPDVTCEAGRLSIEPKTIVTETWTETTGEYTVSYTASDKMGNEADAVQRKVTVKDRYAPTLKLVGDSVVYNSAGAAKNSEYGATKNNQTYWEHDVTGEFNHDMFLKHVDSESDEGGFTCTDSCDKKADLTVEISLYENTECDGDELKDKDAEMVGSVNQWTFPEYATGKYAILYKCTDKSNNWAERCRTVVNVDHTRPIIQVLGSDKMTLEATHQGNYIDDGATCSDQVDGVISQNVEVSGDVVNLSKVGLYQIQYNCKDNANHSADQALRRVWVEQTSCPTCTVRSCDKPTGCKMYHEASFAYTDAGAFCSDVIDGDIDPECVTCSDKHGGCDRGATSRGAGQTDVRSCTSPDLINSAVIGTYYITYVAQNTVNKWNYDSDCRGEPKEYVRTVVVQDTLKPVITLKYDGAPVAQGQPSQYSGEKYNETDGQQVQAGVDQSSETHTALNDNEANGPGVHHRNKDNTPQPGTAKDGKPFSNFELLKGNSFYQPNLMAEETSSGVNGWVLGAIASAVTGLALLGYSQRKTTVATSVPV